MTNKQPGVKASGPAGSRLLAIRDFNTGDRSLFDLLFGSRNDLDPRMTICGPIRKPREVQR